MADGQIIERLSHALNYLHGAIKNAFSKRHHLGQVIAINLAFRKTLITLRQVAREVSCAVAMNLDVGGLDFIQHHTDLRGAHRRVTEKIHELVESVFEVNVVFPKGIVGVDEQMLPALRGCHGLACGASMNGISAMISTSTGAPLRSAGANCQFSRAFTAL